MPDPNPVSLDNLFNDAVTQAQQEGGDGGHSPAPQQPEPYQPQQPQQPPTQQAPSYSPQQPQTPPQQPQQPQPSRATLEALAARGYDVSGFESDDEWFDVAERAEVERQTNERYFQEWNQNRDAFYEWQRQQQSRDPGQQQTLPAQPQPGQQPQEPEKPKWQPPEPSPLALEMAQRGYVSIDPKTGRYKASDPSLAKFESELNQYQDWQREKAKLFLNNPHAWFEETGLADKFKPPEIDRDQLLAEAEERVLQRIQAEANAQRVQSQLEQIAPLLYQTQNGQFVQNQAGEWIPTDIGRKFEHAINTLRAQGEQDPTRIRQLALWHISTDLQAAMQHMQQPGQSPSNPSGQGSSQQPPPQTPQQKREANQESWYERGMNNQNGHNRIPPDDTRILEATRKSKPGNAQGYQRIDDVWDEAFNATLREG